MDGVSLEMAIQAIPNYDETVSGIQEFLQSCLSLFRLIDNDNELEVVQLITAKLTGNAKRQSQNTHLTSFFEIIQILEQELEVQSFMIYMGDQTHGHSLQIGESIQSYADRTVKLERFLIDAALSPGNRSTARRLEGEVSKHILSIFIDGLPIIYQMKLMLRLNSTLPLAVSDALEEELRLSQLPPEETRTMPHVTAAAAASSNINFNTIKAVSSNTVRNFNNATPLYRYWNAAEDHRQNRPNQEYRAGQDTARQCSNGGQTNHTPAVNQQTSSTRGRLRMRPINPDTVTMRDLLQM